MKKTFDIAVVGATGAVGEAILDILSDRNFPVGKVYALASERSLGKTVNYGNRSLDVDDLATFDFSQVQIGLFSAGGSASRGSRPEPHARLSPAAGDRRGRTSLRPCADGERASTVHDLSLRST